MNQSLYVEIWLDSYISINHASRRTWHYPHGPQHWKGCQHEADRFSGQSEIRQSSFRNLLSASALHLRTILNKKIKHCKSIQTMKRTEREDARRQCHGLTSAENERLSTCKWATRQTASIDFRNRNMLQLLTKCIRND